MNQNPQKQPSELAAIHRDNLSKNLQHRLEVARSQGNDNLVSQLEAEKAYLHLK